MKKLFIAAAVMCFLSIMFAILVKYKTEPETKTSSSVNTQIEPIAEIQDTVADPRETNLQKLDRIQDQREAISLISNLIESSRSHGKDFDRKEYLLMCDRLIAKFPELEASANELRARIHGANGKQDAAFAATIAYAEAAANRELNDSSGKSQSTNEIEANTNEIAASKLGNEASDLLGKNVPQAAIQYYTTILAEYPETRQAEISFLPLSRCYELLKHFDNAKAILIRGVIVVKTENVRKQCYEQLARMEFETGNRDKALAVLNEMGNRYNSDEISAYTAFKAAEFQLSDGKAGVVMAMEKYQEVITKFPNTRYAKDSAEMIRVLKLHHPKTHPSVKPPKPQ